MLTYVSRGFEEYRGFPQAMQTIDMLQKRRPNLHVLIVGSDLLLTDLVGLTIARGEWARPICFFDQQRNH